MAEKMKSEKSSIVNQESDVKKHDELIDKLQDIIVLLRELCKNTFPGH